MTKPNAIEEIMVRRAREQCCGHGEDFDLWLEDMRNFPESALTEIMKSALAVLDAAGYEIREKPKT